VIDVILDENYGGNVEIEGIDNNRMERKASRRKLLRGFRSCGRYHFSGLEISGNPN